VTPKNPLPLIADWDIGERLALYYRLEPDGWLMIHAFAPTVAGVDLVGFHVEPCATADPVEVADIVQRINESWALPDVLKPLTSRRLRVLSSGSGAALPDARSQLPLVTWFLDAPTDLPSAPTRADVRLAKLVVRYSELLAKPGARTRLAREKGVSEEAIKSSIRKAKARGLWLTSTSGKAGQPTPRAYQLATQEDRP
jgi:hypothetical protein